MMNNIGGLAGIIVLADRLSMPKVKSIKMIDMLSMFR